MITSLDILKVNKKYDRIYMEREETERQSTTRRKRGIGKENQNTRQGA
jgi:hypothetical protein